MDAKFSKIGLIAQILRQYGPTQISKKLPKTDNLLVFFTGNASNLKIEKFTYRVNLSKEITRATKKLTIEFILCFYANKATFRYHLPVYIFHRQNKRKKLH